MVGLGFEPKAAGLYVQTKARSCGSRLNISLSLDPHRFADPEDETVVLISGRILERNARFDSTSQRLLRQTD